MDDILLCKVSCTGTVQDDYTTAWAVSSLLFYDNFENPVYSGGQYNTNGNVNNSLGRHDWDEMESYRQLAVTSFLRFHQFPFWDPYRAAATRTGPLQKRGP